MIKDFKIFENVYGTKYWFCLQVRNENVENNYNLIKDMGIEIFFYNSSKDRIFFLIHVDEKTMKEIGLPHFKSTNDVKLKLDNYNDTIPDIKEWLKNYKYNQVLKNYNL